MGGKLSFKWEAGSCSSTSSVVYLPLSFVSAPARRMEQQAKIHDYIIEKLQDDKRVSW